MADASVIQQGGLSPRLERLRMAAGVVAAVAGAVTGLWGIYQKVKTDARQYTTASYDTLAPQMNQMAEALRQLQQDNQQLRVLLAERAGRRVSRPASDHKTAQPAGQAAAQPQASPGQAPPPTPPAQQGSAPAQPAAGDTLDQVLNTVERTRQTVEQIGHVPDKFSKVLEQRQK